MTQDPMRHWLNTAARLDEAADMVLTERVTDSTLYHATSYYAAALILRDDIIHAKTRHTIGGKSVYGVSLTRNKRFARTWSYVTFALDGALLRHRYRVLPFNYWSTSSEIERQTQGREEAEEFVVGDIRNASRYITEIIADKSRLERHARDTNFYDTLLHHPLLRSQ